MAPWIALRLLAGVASALTFVIAVSSLLSNLQGHPAHLPGWAFAESAPASRCPACWSWFVRVVALDAATAAAVLRNGFPHHMPLVRNVAPARQPALAETAPDPSRVPA